MGILNSISRTFQPVTVHAPETTTAASEPGIEVAAVNTEKNDVEVDIDLKATGEARQDLESGVARVEAAQAVWGKYGFWIIAAGIGMLMLVYELDNTTVYIYNTYALSSFNQLSIGAALSTAGVIVFAVVKPPIAKLSNIIGRGETYCFTISCYILAYILFASAKTFGAYAAGYIFYCVGQSGTNIMNDIVISDITTARWRGLAIAVSFFPFLFMPWISAFIVSSVVSSGGIGWKWGIGMLAILMPFCASFIIGTLFYYQHKAKKAGIVVIAKDKMTIYEFFSQIDLGGTLLFSFGFAMFLLPMTLAASTPQGWQTPWIAALIALGGAFLIALPFYEQRFAKHPLVPFYYFKNTAIVISGTLLLTDALGFSVTHSYLYPWSTIARGLSARDATFLQTTNGVMQTLSSILGGMVMLKTRRYKWLVMFAVTIRFIGYCVMIRLRGAENPIAELFIVQLLQGFGSGVILIGTLVSAQIQVPHSQLAQITALILCCNFLGSSIGASISGGIYTNTLKDELAKQLGAGADQSLINSLYNSITGVVPEWGSPERESINAAYSNVIRYMTYTAVGSMVPSFILTWFMPNMELP
ncbi:siderochrome-iron transporter [Cadophora sp. DSE1049]|nr:siderochrome-iron transporter [Cadophora sp. DSE1049]